MIRELGIQGAWEVTPRQFGDRARLLADYVTSDLAEVGITLPTGRHALSVSALGSLRGIHYTIPGEARYVTCTRGAVWDVIVDIRTSSPTFGTWDAVRLDDVDRRAVYISSGLGHGFMALSDDATLTYLCGREYDPAAEMAISPFDPMLGILWPMKPTSLSERDEAALSLTVARDAGRLPA